MKRKRKLSTQGSRGSGRRAIGGVMAVLAGVGWGSEVEACGGDTVVVSYHIPAEGDLAAEKDRIAQGFFTVHAEVERGGQWVKECAQAQFAGGPGGSSTTLTCLPHTPRPLSGGTLLTALLPLENEEGRAAGLAAVRLGPREVLECLSGGEPVTVQVVDGTVDRAIFRLPEAPHAYAKAPDALAQFLEKDAASGFFFTEKWSYAAGKGIEMDVVLAGVSQTNVTQARQIIGQECACLTPLPGPGAAASDRRARTAPAVPTKTYHATVDYLFEDMEQREDWKGGMIPTPLSRQQFLDMMIGMFHDAAAGHVTLVECKDGVEGRTLPFSELEALLTPEMMMPVFDLNTGERLGEGAMQVEWSLENLMGWRTSEVWTVTSHPFGWEKKVVAVELLRPVYSEDSGEPEGWAPLIPVRFKFPQG